MSFSRLSATLCTSSLPSTVSTSFPLNLNLVNFNENAMLSLAKLKVVWDSWPDLCTFIAALPLCLLQHIRLPQWVAETSNYPLPSSPIALSKDFCLRCSLLPTVCVCHLSNLTAWIFLTVHNCFLFGYWVIPKHKLQAFTQCNCACSVLVEHSGRIWLHKLKSVCIS